jgi:hypothetical protein
VAENFVKGHRVANATTNPSPTRFAQGCRSRRKTHRLSTVINIKQLQKKNGKSQVIGEENSPGEEKSSPQQVLR